MMLYIKDNGPAIQKHGTKMMKRPNPVWMQQINESFEVVTNEGLMTGKPGDYVAYDPISGHTWPVSAEYVKQHYDPV